MTEMTTVGGSGNVGHYGRRLTNSVASYSIINTVFGSLFQNESCEILDPSLRSLIDEVWLNFEHKRGLNNPVESV